MIAKALQRLAVPIESLTPHPRNARQGDVGAITQSLERFGQVRPIVVQKSTGYVVAGNHVHAAARALGWPKVARVAVEMTDQEALAYLVADNRIADLGTYDDQGIADLLTELANAGELVGTGYDGEDLDRLLADIASEADTEAPPYTAKVESPVYEPRGDRPPVEALADVERRDALIAAIDAAGLPDDLRAFLVLAAHRHTRFDYETIAEFYAHADPEVQRLMEASALVIIDFDQAIERGFVTLNDAIAEAFTGDYPDA